jgi:hypothetical protein
VPDCSHSNHAPRMTTSKLRCDAPECLACIEADHARDIDLPDAYAVLVTAAAALGWQVGAGYSSAHSFDLCPGHRL